MESIHSLCSCDTVSAYVESCCFNPTIYFVCKLCRGAFDNVEKLLNHKRQEHTLNELKGIKFIAFEERIVEADANTFPSALLATSVELKCENQDTTGDTNLDQHLHQGENHDIKTIVDIPRKSGEIKLPNPYVYLKRLSALEIRSYTRYSRPPQNIQHPEECTEEINEDNQCAFNDENTLYNNTAVAVDSESENINDSSNSASNRNASAEAVYLTDSHVARVTQNEEIVRVPESFEFENLLEKVIIRQLKSRCKSAKSSESAAGSSTSSFPSFRNIVSPPASPINSTTQEEIQVVSSKRCKLSNAETYCSNSNSNPEISSAQSAVIYANANPTAELESEIKEQELADGEFIVANIVQSSNGIGKVQFLSTCNPVTAVTGADVSTVDSEVKENAESVTKENYFEPVESNNYASPSPVPLPMPSEIEGLNLNPNTHYDDFSNKDQVSIETDAPTIRVSAHYWTPELLSIFPVSPSSINNIASTRTLRNRSKINYSENQTCAKCSMDFYTVEALEAHEKVCVRIRNKNNRNTFHRRGLPAWIPISDRAQAAHDDIQVIQTAAASPKDVEVEVIESEGDDKDYEDQGQDVSSSDSDSESEESGGTRRRPGGTCRPALVKINVYRPLVRLAKHEARPRPLIEPDPGALHHLAPPVPPGLGARKKLRNNDIHSKYTPCPLSIKEWLKKERATNPKNIICLDPDPFQGETDDVADTEATVFVVTTETPLKCKLCSKTLTSNVIAKTHLNYCWRYNKIKHFYCPICPKQLTGKRGMYRHNRLKHPEPGDLPVPSHKRRMKCTVCSKEFYTQKSSFKKHMETHEKPNEKNFVCEICGTGFRRKQGLQRHHLTHSEERPLKCKFCPKTFKKDYCLSMHQEVHAKDKNFHCSTCSKSFGSKRRLKMHSRIHLNDRRYCCKAENCDLKFFSRTSVSYHCKREHKELFSQRAKFSCTVCNEKFEYSSLLKKHEMVHSGEKPFKCSAEGCGRAFQEKVNLDEHLRQHTGERPFQCDKCGTSFWKVYSFQKHMKRHNNPADQVLCHLCPRKFPGNYELQQHLIFHEKGKQFKCDTCGFKCMTKAGLKGHMKTHERKGDTEIDSSSSESDGEDEEETTEESASASEPEPESESEAPDSENDSR